MYQEQLNINIRITSKVPDSQKDNEIIVFSDIENRYSIIDGLKNKIKQENFQENFSSLNWSFSGSGVLFSKEKTFRTPLKSPLFIVTALWPIKSKHSESFFIKAKSNALESINNEKGCLAFGTFKSKSSNSVFSMIEIFESSHDFEKHLKESHFMKFIEFARPVYLGNRNQTIKGLLI